MILWNEWCPCTVFMRPKALPWFGVGNSSTLMTQKAVSWAIFVAVLVSSRSCALKPLNPTWTYCLGDRRHSGIFALKIPCFAPGLDFQLVAGRGSSSGTEFSAFRNSVYVKQPQGWRKITLILKDGAFQLCRGAFTQTCSPTSVWDFWACPIRCLKCYFFLQ